MGNHACVNGTLDGANYSSPVPMIGLYIAAASLISMLLMLCDMVNAFRKKFRWLPNHFFSLDSVTLVLLSIATKLTVDLTTPMPHSLDQLSKLSGTTFICISMGFLMPSLRGGPETFTNLIALTIFVVTVAVNICIQLYTGVISLFFVEHILILCCMMVLLEISWEIFIENQAQQLGLEYVDHNKYLFKPGTQSLFQRLKLCYLTHCDSACKLDRHDNGGRLSGVCLMSAIILAQAAVRSLVLKKLEFCLGTSDYSWSMPPIVASQTLTVAIGCLAIAFRWISMFPMVDWETPEPQYEIHMDDVTSSIAPLGRVWTIGIFIYDVIYAVTFILQFFMILLAKIFTYLTSFGICNTNPDYTEAMQDIRDLIPQEEEDLLNSWFIFKNIYSLNMGIQTSKKKTVSNLFNLLSQTSPSPQSQINSMQIKDEAYPNQQGVEVSSFSLALLVRIAQVSIPDHLCGSLFQALEEADEIHQFIDEKMNSKASKTRIKIGVANLLLGPSHDFRPLLPKILGSETEQQLHQSDLHRATYIMLNLRSALPPDPIWDKVLVMVFFIHRKRYSSIQDLYNSIEQLFVDMISQLLSQLPHAVFKSLCESSIADYGDVLQDSLTYLSILEPLEELFQWSFPEELNISRLITAEQVPTEEVVNGDVIVHVA